MATTMVDIDGHILEQPDIWDSNLEAEYTARSMHFSKDEKGLEVWLVDGKPHPFLAGGTSANMASYGKSQEWRQENIFEKHSVSWEDGRAMNPGGSDPNERAKLMDEEGIDKSILYPSLGLDWPGTVEAPLLLAAYCRVYNDWIVDFCHTQPTRLYPALLMPWTSVSETIKELRRTASVGSRAVLTPGIPFNDIPYGDSLWDPVWSEFIDQDIPVSLHPASGGTSARSGYYSQPTTPTWWGFSTDVLNIQLTFMSFFQTGVFDRFPEMKLIVLESGCLWMPYVLERMDEKQEILGFTTPMKLRPSEYFEKQCWITMEPGDEFGPIVINLLGADKVVWAYDYPHSDSPTGPVKTLRKDLKDLSEEDRNKVMGGNAVKLYKLN